ncbi:RNA 2',3'-cyclic phosphodiesterase [Paenibacillus campi]|uniref:RNA 2',3'-cyclic phosphodiesterase n=1 Tax=Paenibacillus campi TaxID=3106031 RepID=UPI002B000197|nr:RNA 2',3'-cyclic phosphodiesterase [Paenibacillus sp. SGZ-1014]
MATGSEQERVFAAIAVKGAAQQCLAAWSAQMQQHYAFRKWTDSADLHITLQFYGDVDRAYLPELSQTLTAAVSAHTPFTLELGAIGSFGLPARPRVLWIDPAGDRHALMSLQSDIVRACAAIGYQAEQRPYHPHITIARKYADTEPIKPLVFDEIEWQHPNWCVQSVVLYCTRVGSIPMYEAAGHFPLIGDGIL